MKLSFVIPAYNEEKYIVDCLQSIFSLRGLGEFEVIVVDNNSTDQTALVAKQKFPRTTVIKETKRGPAVARNAGAKVARGEFLAFVDADCRMPVDWWLKVEKSFSGSPQLAMVNGPYRYFEAQSVWARLMYYVTNDLAGRLAEFFYRRLLGRGVIAFGGDMVVRKTAFQRIRGFDEQFDFYGEDVDIANRLMREGEVRFNPEIWLYSSVRRLKQAGHLRMWFVYSFNGLAVGLFGKVLFKDKRYRPFR